jgi:pyruvate carboxylase subunit B
VIYFVTVGGREYRLELDGDTVTLTGRTHRVELRDIPGTPLRHLVVDGRSHVLAATPEGPGRWVLLHRGEAVVVEALDERGRHLRDLAGTGRVHAAGGAIRAPMPGLVVRVLVERGASVSAGAGLVVLEAMKMENELKAAAAATVTQVLVRPGQAVEKGQTLVVLGGPAANEGG